VLQSGDAGYLGRLERVAVDGRAWSHFDAAQRAVDLPASSRPRRVVVTLAPPPARSAPR
jgi:hypothetical protein